MSGDVLPSAQIDKMKCFGAGSYPRLSWNVSAMPGATSSVTSTYRPPATSITETVTMKRNPPSPHQHRYPSLSGVPATYSHRQRHIIGEGDITAHQILDIVGVSDRFQIRGSVERSPKRALARPSTESEWGNRGTKPPDPVYVHRCWRVSHHRNAT